MINKYANIKLAVLNEVFPNESIVLMIIDLILNVQRKRINLRYMISKFITIQQNLTIKIRNNN